MELIRDASYEGVDLALSPTDFDTENAEYVLRVSEMVGIPVVSITAYERKMDQETVDRIVVLAKALKVKIVNFFPPHRLDKDGTWFSEYLPKAQEENKDITFSVVNVEPKTFLFFIPEYKDATLTSIKKITGATTLSVSNVDTESGVDLIKTFTVLGNSIMNIFLSDKAGAREGLIPGKGEMPLETLLIRLKEGGYKRLFTLRVDPKALGVGDDTMVITRMIEAKAFFEKHYKSGI